MSKVLKIGIPVVVVMSLLAVYSTNSRDEQPDLGGNRPVPNSTGTPQGAAAPAPTSDAEAAAIEAELSALAVDGSNADEGLNDEPIPQQE